jgi:hypothetical protein
MKQRGLLCVHNAKKGSAITGKMHAVPRVGIDGMQVLYQQVHVYVVGAEFGNV